MSLNAKKEKQLLVVIDGRGSLHKPHQQVELEGLPEINHLPISKIMVGAGMESVLITDSFEKFQEKKMKHYHYIRADERLMINGHTPTSHEIMQAIKNTLSHCAVSETCLTAVPPEIGEIIWGKITGQAEELLPLEVIKISLGENQRLTATKCG